MTARKMHEEIEIIYLLQNVSVALVERRTGDDGYLELDFQHNGHSQELPKTIPSP